MFAIETVGLSYRFAQQVVVNDLSLQVPKGSIYGFLGPNGAGKTTTIKILLSLLPSPKDKVFIFGNDLNTHRISTLKQMGALVEQPAIYTHLSGRENLINRCLLLGIARNRADEMLKRVGLQEAAHKKAGKYSLGMKQRLGIALALVAEPELLLLDEPTNGLDPNGIIEIRNLMTDLATQYGKTILVSSHLLAEIERTATHVGIINKGKLLFQGSINALHDLSKPGILIEVDDIEKAAALLSPGHQILRKEDHRLTLAFQDKADIARVNRLLVDNGLSVYRLGAERKDLEHLFLDITSNH